MRIVVETERDKWVVGESGDSLAFRVQVHVDGEHYNALTHAIAESEMQSEFDIIWEYLGTQIKQRYAEKACALAGHAT